MERFFGRFAPQVFSILRILTGVMFALHGTDKLFGWPSGGDPAGDTLMQVAGVIELVTGTMMALGLLFGWAAFLASGQMAVAYFMKHAPEGFWPIMNRGELAALYCFLFLWFAAHGAGFWSVDTSRRARPFFLARYEHVLFVVLRVVAGLMFLIHGTMKLWGWPAGRPPASGALAITAGWIEVIAGAMIVTGIAASWAAFVASGTMAAAYFIRHFGDPSWIPNVNRGELAVTYCFLWLYLATRGNKREEAVHANALNAPSR